MVSNGICLVELYNSFYMMMSIFMALLQVNDVVAVSCSSRSQSDFFK